MKKKILLLTSPFVISVTLLLLFCGNCRQWICGRADDADSVLIGRMSVDGEINPIYVGVHEYDTLLYDEPVTISDDVTLDSALLYLLPSPLKDRPEQLLVRKSYVVSYNKDLRIPNWVAWHLTAVHASGELPRYNNFREDLDVPAPRATPTDYKGSGWSRGHMCPSGDNKWDAQANKETFLLSNLCPQDAKLNSGLWNSIEMDCRKWAKKYGDLYIVCGPLPLRSPYETIGPNKVAVPRAFFKIVLCLNGKPKGFGIVVKNNSGEKKNTLYYHTIREVERITGYDFFPFLPTDIQESVETLSDMSEW